MRIGLYSDVPDFSPCKAHRTSCGPGATLLKGDASRDSQCACEDESFVGDPYSSIGCTHAPSASPTKSPTGEPTPSPTLRPTVFPTKAPTRNPSLRPTAAPTDYPTPSPTLSPTHLQRYLQRAVLQKGNMPPCTFQLIVTNIWPLT